MNGITVFQNSLTTGMISCYPIGKLCARHVYLSMHLDHGEKNRGFFLFLKDYIFYISTQVMNVTAQNTGVNF